MHIWVNSDIVIRVDSEYRLDSPGVVAEAFSQFRGTSTKEAFESFASYSHQEFDYWFSDNTQLYDLLDKVAKQMGFFKEKDYFYQIVKPAFFYQDKIVYVYNHQFFLGELYQQLSLSQGERLFLVFSGDVGAVFRNEDAGYYYSFRSHEGTRHGTPHLHVDYKHEHFASFSLLDGGMIAGEMPQKQQKRIKDKIMKNQKLLCSEWNRQTDGIRLDLNYSLGSIIMNMD